MNCHYINLLKSPNNVLKVYACILIDAFNLNIVYKENKSIY